MIVTGSRRVTPRDSNTNNNDSTIPTSTSHNTIEAKSLMIERKGLEL